MKYNHIDLKKFKADTFIEIPKDHTVTIDVEASSYNYGNIASIARLVFPPADEGEVIKEEELSIPLGADDDM